MKTKWKVIIISVISIIAVLLLTVFFIQSFKNKAISLEERIDTARSDISVQEKARVDKVYNLADCVKQYDKHEAEIIKSIAQGRENTTGDIENVKTVIEAVAEAYPDLKSSNNYQKFMNELIMIENTIAEYRSNYNKKVEEYNKYVRSFPTRIFLDLTGYNVNEYQKLEFENAPVDAPTNLFGD